MDTTKTQDAATHKPLVPVEIVLSHGGARWTTTVMGEQRGPAGLLVTPELAAEENGAVFYTGDWTVIHAKTGNNLGAFATPRGAGVFCEALADVPGVDWAGDLPATADDPFWTAPRRAAISVARMKAGHEDQSVAYRQSLEAF